VEIISEVWGVANPRSMQRRKKAYEFFTTHCTLTQEEQELYRRILLDGKTKGRYLGMDCKTDAPRNRSRPAAGAISQVAAGPQPSPPHAARWPKAGVEAADIAA